MTLLQAGANAALTWFFVGDLVLRRGAAAKQWSPTPDDRGTMMLMVGALVASVAVLSVPFLHRWPVPAWLASAGLAMAALGTALRIWAMRVLGRFYSRALMVQDGHAVVAEGPYAVIRHPGYGGALLVWVGAALAIGYGAAAVVVTLVLLAAYARRIAVEERMLTATLGESYRTYQARTARLVPGVW
jgi:protein-S-isoprenylcysteine O-methyltransferase